MSIPNPNIGADEKSGQLKIRADAYVRLKPGTVFREESPRALLVR